MTQSIWRSSLRVLLLATTVCVFTRPALAIEMADYVKDVIDANPQVLESVEVYRQALQEREIAKSGWKPSVDLTGTIGRTQSDTLTNNSQRGDYSSNSIELALTQNIFNGFDTENNIKQADARVQAALYELYDTIDNIALEAVQAYLEVMRQKRLYELAQENVNSHEETLRQIKVRDESGVARRSELEQTEGRVALAYSSMIAQRNNLEDALTQLHELLGRYLDIDDFSEPTAPIALQKDLNATIDDALANHPALKVAQYNIEAARYDHKRSKSSFLPSLDVRLAQEINDNIDDSGDNDDELTLSLNLNYNLYNGGADRAEQRRRVNVINEQQQFASRVRRQVINTLRLAWKADRLLETQLGYLNKHVVKSRETMLSYQEEFFVGERDLIDLLDVKNELNSAQNNYSDAYYEAVGARYRTYEGVGDLFSALGVDVDVSDDDLTISKIAALGADVSLASINLDPDSDEDGVKDRVDQCDNSGDKESVKEFGCSPVNGSKAYQPNNAPKAKDDDIDAVMNAVRTISMASLMENDLDSDKDALKFVNFSQPNYGKLALGQEGELVYRALDGFSGTDRFSYTVEDARGSYSTATVRINISSGLSTDEAQLVNFIVGKTDLTDASEGLLGLVAAHLKNNPSLSVKVFTHTDSDGSRSFNKRLSEQRAQAMLKALVSSGVDASRVSVKGMGEENPIADNSTVEGKAINRRGEFLFIEQ